MPRDETEWYEAIVANGKLVSKEPVHRVKSCDLHPAYRKGCGECAETARRYQASRRPGPVPPPTNRHLRDRANWNRMNAIGAAGD